MTPKGNDIVRKEVYDTLQGGPPLKELGSLMTRIQYGRQLSGDVADLGQGLKEARLSYQGNMYRLYFAQARGQAALLLGLKFHAKGSQGKQDRMVKIARERLADARQQGIC